MSARPASLSRTASSPRHCRRRAIDPGSPRPSELLSAFFLAGLLSIAAAALAGATYALSGSDWLYWLSLLPSNTRPASYVRVHNIGLRYEHSARRPRPVAPAVDPGT
jgi:hypothetical protein